MVFDTALSEEVISVPANSPDRLCYDAAGNLTQDRRGYEYDAYGNPIIWNADFTAKKDNSNYGNPYLWS